MKKIYTVTTGEYEDEYTVAAFESEKEAEEFCEIVQGRIFEVPLNPSRDSWIMHETTISGNIREGEYFPASILTYIMDDPFKKEIEYDKDQLYWSYNARGKTEEESRMKCEGIMRKFTGFNSDLEKVITGEVERREMELKNFIARYGSASAITGSIFPLNTNQETGIISKS